MADVIKYSRSFNDLVKVLESFTQDQIDTDQYLVFFNECVSDINVRCGTLFPYWEDENQDTYEAIPRPWDQIFVLYGAWQQKTGNQEYVDMQEFKDRYESLFRKFEISYLPLIDDKYKGPLFGVSTNTKENDWTKNKLAKLGTKSDSLPVPYWGSKRSWKK